MKKAAKSGGKYIIGIMLWLCMRIVENDLFI